MWFKLAFVVVFLCATTIAARTARLASRRHGGSLNQLSHEVPGLLAARAALGLVFYAALFTWFFLPDTLLWTYWPVTESARWLAVVLLGPTLLFFAWSFETLGVNYRGGVGVYPDHTLVTHGPYRTLRHPIYASFIAIMLLVLVLSANWALGLSGLLLVVSIAAVRIPIEEKQLHDKFGEDWTEYRTRTGRLFPRWRM